MPTPWDPFHPAVFVEPSPHAAHVSLVRHDGYPYVAAWNEGTGWPGLFDIATAYITDVNPRLKLPPAWLANLREEPPSGPPPPVSLHWLRDGQDPRHSYWVERQGGLDDSTRPRSGPVLDRAAVLLAGLWFKAQNIPRIPLYGGQGLRVILQADLGNVDSIPVRITGVASTLPSTPTARITAQMLEDVPRRIANTFALPSGVELVDIGIRVSGAEAEAEQLPIVFAKTATSGYSEGYGPYNNGSYLLVMRANPKVAHGLEPLARRLLVAAAAGPADADVFVQDPVSRNGAGHFSRLRPNRSWTMLDPERANVILGNLPPGSGAGLVQLVDPDPHTPPEPDFRVTNARLVDPPAPDGATHEVASSVHDHVRTNVFAAVNAFHHTSDLFRRLRQYGLPPASYFRFVARPIEIQYRSGITPGVGDGRTVNAQVRWTLRPDTKSGWTKGTIEVCFALGDLDSAVGRLPANLQIAGERSALGVASDPRWCWHECCHVLLTAAVGDLELRFAHSAGDAIAAILSDPDSELTKDSSGSLANDGPWRGVTFPWVLIPRRHDRHVRDGWSWTGPLNRREAYFALPGLSDKRGYWAEQILSSSLFRLYRAIGGDSERLAGGQPTPARPERRNAADYVVYLIMRAIQSLGAAAVTPSTDPNQFVDAMRKADTATASVPGPGGYVGGTVHKVVQWAFERQGLYGLPDPGSAVSGPEEVAAVDLHIEDRRLKRDGPYSPVDLLGDGWHAHPNFFWVRGPFLWGRKRRIRVRVQNRGITQAADTRVDVWVAPVNDGATPPMPKIPAFPDPSWKVLGSASGSVPGRSGQTPGARTFGPFHWTPLEGPPQKYAILAAATCLADPSNIDPTTGHPCVTVSSPIELLVGCDNNLGLITVTID